MMYFKYNTVAGASRGSHKSARHFVYYLTLDLLHDTWFATWYLIYHVLLDLLHDTWFTTWYLIYYMIPDLLHDTWFTTRYVYSTDFWVFLRAAAAGTP